MIHYLLNKIRIDSICFFVLLAIFNNSIGKCFSQDTVCLPFVDDFSSPINEKLWQNNGAYFNCGFQFMPITIGVATLDILDKNGHIYPQANIYSFAADTLASMPIRLDSIKEPVNKKLSLSDSIWFSFFVQPGGAMGNLWERIGSAPSVKDSLILQFYKSNQDTWTTVWKINGLDLESIYKKDSIYALQYLIPLTDTAFFNRNFQFRFINYGSLDNNPSYDYVSNKGQWNIDYVYMNINRNFKDSTYRDVAFVTPTSSFLKYFTAIPAKHFKKEYMKDTVYSTIINLHSSTLNSYYSFNIKDNNNNIIHSYEGGFENIVSYPKTHKFQTAENHIAHKLNFSFNPPANTFSQYTLTHIVSEGVGQDNIKTNDTIRFVQKFENYFAYDDGTSEGGIGIEPSSSSLFCVRYPLLTQDTLFAVDIYFNSSWKNANITPFYLYVYSATEDSLSLPDKELYASVKLTPVHDSLNKFSRYYLSEPLVLPQGNFFIALNSATPTYLNIGFDQNNDASEFMFEKRGNKWFNIFFKGAPMIRPYFGYATVGTNSMNKKENIVNIYPNPAKDEVYIDVLGKVDVQLFSINGKLLRVSNENKINVSDLNNGIYILKVNNIVKKLIIAK